jgi:hypothetical protein
MKHSLVLILALCAGPAHAARAEPLAQDDHVTTMLVAAQVGDILRGTCPQVSARMFVVLGEMVALERHAKSKGHDDAAIRAFLDSPDEKARIRALADAHLVAAGVVAGDIGSYCAAARAEVAAGSVAGSLIRVDP